MTDNLDGLRILQKHSHLPVSSIRYVPNADASIVQSIQNGILFFAAFWSGTSLQAFSKLTQAMEQLKQNRFELVVVDVDGALELYQSPILNTLLGGTGFSAPQGCGEVVYCRDGQMVYAAMLGTGGDSKQYRINAEKFLSACQFE